VQVQALAYRSFPARADLGFLNGLFAVVVAGSVSTHKLNGAVEIIPSDKLVGLLKSVGS
jgi:hypothetical protein